MSRRSCEEHNETYGTAIVKVRFYELALDGSGDQEVGSISLEGGLLVVNPESRLILTRFIEKPLMVHEKGKSVRLHPLKEPEAFLRALSRAIHDSYLWAGPLEE
jgi:hypothetical protein